MVDKRLEPLKNKMLFSILEEEKIIGDLFLASDIKSAFNWLKDKGGCNNCSNDCQFYKGNKRCLLNEAFQDVMKNG